jgi:hypothetical protein
MEWMNETESVDKAAGQCNRRGDDTAGGEDQSDEENILRHVFSVPHDRIRVQAGILMTYLRIL